MAKLEIVAEFTNRTQADIAMGILKARGISAMIHGDDLGGQGPGQSFVQRVQVMVRQEDLEEAKTLLESADSDG